MAIGLVGRKSGMTRIFTEDGASIPVTVIEVDPNRITQLKTEQRDGYTAVQVTDRLAQGAARDEGAWPGTLRRPAASRAAVCGNSASTGEATAELAPVRTLGVDQFEAGPEGRRVRHLER